MTDPQKCFRHRKKRTEPTGSGRAIWSLATRTLRRYECGLCGQRLDRMRKSPKNCARLCFHGVSECDWHEFLQPETHTHDEENDDGSRKPV